MDRLESLGNQLSQITLYDIKSMYNQAKNVVFNVSEMEAKVREATNDEPWGASSTLMQDIAQGTFNFQNFNEVMPAIYARFMEKEARQWRQIYKALQLLEYLVKNGSERVVDDARSHISTIKMLRNFYYVDEKGKDQGINVRNRSRELVELLSDVEKIRTERRKAKANKHKYTGAGNEALSFNSGGGRYGGFGSDSLAYGGSGSGSSSYGGGSSSYSGGGDYSGGGFRDVDNGRRGYQEYDAGDDDTAPRRSNSLVGARSSGSASNPRRASTLPQASAPPPKAKEPEPVIDLLGMDDDPFPAPTQPPADANKALPPVAAAPVAVDDDFDDFQAAPPSASTTMSFTAPSAPAAAPAAAPPLTQQVSFVAQPMQPTSPPWSPPVPNYTSPPPPFMKPMFSGQSALTPTTLQPTPPPPRTVTSPPVGGALKPAGSTPKPVASANFDDLWTMSLGGSSASKTPVGSGAPAKSIKDLEKEKAQAGIWQASASRPPMGAPLGSFGATGTSAAASSGNGLDDLLF
ncbi:ENTH-domain-containing protein [Obba rivulosa]|uniref:ENTH-domain-containing protein n=1 Tax=Obba rivulosa TaxID=1052685 RepID=A0A8E2DM07_9APHY|nr:ENTH-domain-containing protein [Obba rivulosa]